MSRRGSLLFLAALPLCVLLLSQAAVGAAAGQGSNRWAPGYSSTSWALGVVVPEGAQLQGGEALSWESVTNLTALTTLPSVSSPDGIVYVVLSAMAGDGSVMQVAAGVYPNSSIWLAFSWFVQGVQSPRPSYVWILNSSAPDMSAGDMVSLSIFLSFGQWRLGVADSTTGNETSRSFPSGIAQSLKAGEQEAFALESYSRTAADFQSMGNLTLRGLYADGRRVTGGLYPYGGWDPARNPVFVVGSSGTSPPVFMSIGGGNGTVVWSYSEAWGGNVAPVGAFWPAAVIVGLLGALAVVWAAYRVVKAPVLNPPQEPQAVAQDAGWFLKT